MGQGPRHAGRARAGRAPTAAAAPASTRTSSRRWSPTRTSSSRTARPRASLVDYPRASDELPREAQEIKPHPHGVELGMLLKMMQDAPEDDGEGGARRQLLARLAARSPQSICEHAQVKPTKKAPDLSGEEVERLHKALGEVKVMAPPATCIVPIGEELIVAGLKRRFIGGEYFSDHAPPVGLPRQSVRGRSAASPTAAICLSTSPPRCMRFANRVPLQYQPKACAISEAVYELNWKNYGLAQPRGSLPDRPDGHLRAPGERLGSVHQRGQRSGRSLPRALARNHARAPGMRPQAGAEPCVRGRAPRARGSARAFSSATSPSSGRASARSPGKHREDIEKSFFKALPNFVNLAEISRRRAVAEPKGPPPADGGNGDCRCVPSRQEAALRRDQRAHRTARPPERSPQEGQGAQGSHAPGPARRLPSRPARRASN